VAPCGSGDPDNLRVNASSRATGTMPPGPIPGDLLRGRIRGLERGRRFLTRRAAEGRFGPLQSVSRADFFSNCYQPCRFRCRIATDRDNRRFQAGGNPVSALIFPPLRMPIV